MRDMKDSGIEWIGDIPVSWKTCKYKYFTENGMGETILKEDLKSNGIPVYSATQEDVCFGFIDNPRVILHKGDFIIPARGNSIGCVSFVKDEIATCTQTTIYSKLTGRPIVDKYLFYCALGLKDIWFKFDQTAIPQITVAQVENNIVPLPISESEQQAIADYLDGECARIDGIVTTQRQIIERLKEYKKSVITEAVTRGLNPDTPMKDSAIDWIGKIPEHWEVRRIKTLGEYRNGLTYNPENMVDESNGTLVLRSSNIQNGKIVLDDNVFVNTIIPEQLLVHKGDIIICSRNGSRELVGKNALIKEDIMASFGAFMMIFRTNYPEYISYILNSAIFSYYLSTFFTATINQLTGSNFGNMQIVFCPDLNEQQEIIDYLDKECARIDTIIEKRERMIELMTEYKKSLIYECVTGKKEVA